MILKPFIRNKNVSVAQSMGKIRGQDMHHQAQPGEELRGEIGEWKREREMLQ